MSLIHVILRMIVCSCSIIFLDNFFSVFSFSVCKWHFMSFWLRWPPSILDPSGFLAHLLFACPFLYLSILELRHLLSTEFCSCVDLFLYLRKGNERNWTLEYTCRCLQMSYPQKVLERFSPVDPLLLLHAIKSDRGYNKSSKSLAVTLHVYIFLLLSSLFSLSSPPYQRNPLMSSPSIKKSIFLLCSGGRDCIGCYYTRSNISQG